MTIDAAGWVKGAEDIPSPNFDDRPDGDTVDLLVIHNISLPARHYGGDDVIRLFTNQLDPNAFPNDPDLAYERLSASGFNNVLFTPSSRDALAKAFSGCPEKHIQTQTRL